MKYIKREIKSEITSLDKDFDIIRCQASFNSDGALMLRNYNKYNKDNDDILVFSKTETRAIIELFRKTSQDIKSNELPF